MEIKQFNELQSGDLVYFLNTDFMITAIHKVIEIENGAIKFENGLILNLHKTDLKECEINYRDNYITTDEGQFLKQFSRRNINYTHESLLKEIEDLKLIQDKIKDLEQVKQMYLENKEEIEKIMKMYESND
jgi:hypothetical protein